MSVERGGTGEASREDDREPSGSTGVFWTIFILVLIGISFLATGMALSSQGPWFPGSVATRVYLVLFASGTLMFSAALLLLLRSPRMGLGSGRRYRQTSVRRRFRLGLRGALVGSTLFTAISGVALVLFSGPGTSFRITTALVLFLTYGWMVLTAWFVGTLLSAQRRTRRHARPASRTRRTIGSQLRPAAAFATIALFLTWIVFAPLPEAGIKIDGDMSDWRSIPGPEDSDRDAVVRVTSPTFILAFPAPGSYDVVVNVTDAGGASATSSIRVILPNEPPEAAFVATTDELNATFDASGSGDLDGEVETYVWDFGDGATGTGSVTTHTYFASGPKVVTLTVVDDDGARAQSTRTVTVAGPNRAPTPDARVRISDLTVSVDASHSFDPDGTVASFLWEFGDGGVSTEPITSHTYGATGLYLIRLTVVDAAGEPASIEYPVSVPNIRPEARFSYQVDLLSVAFDGRNSTDDSGLVEFEWTFGDGAAASGPVVRHQYASGGSYAVVLTVRDSLGAEASVVQLVMVDAGPNPESPPVAGFSFTVNGLYVLFAAVEAYDPDGKIVAYMWDFGDGTSASGFTASHLYTEPTSYLVSLTVFDDDGRSGTRSSTVDLSLAEPSGRPPVLHTDVRVTQLAVFFDASKSTGEASPVVLYEWRILMPSSGVDLVRAKSVREGDSISLYAEAARPLFPFPATASSVVFYIDTGGSSATYFPGNIRADFMLRVSGSAGRILAAQLLWYFGYASSEGSFTWQIVSIPVAAIGGNALEVRLYASSLLNGSQRPIRITSQVEVGGLAADTVAAMELD